MTNNNTSASTTSLDSTFDVIINGIKFAECYALKGNYMYCYFSPANKKNQPNKVNPPNLILKLHIHIYANNGYKSHIFFYS